MTVHSFALKLTGLDTLGNAYENKLYEAGCSDALIFVVDGDLFLDFDREATSLIDAVRAAVKDIEKAGAQMVEVHMLEAIH